MKVFLSWSGERSRLVASALRDWLPLVINEVSPFVSSDDIHAGTRWLTEITAELESTNFGILCVTKENQRMPWLNFEAGALAKAVDTSRVIPLAIGLRPAEIQNPLGQFQSQPLTHGGMSKIVSSLNSVLPKPLLTIENSITKLWPHLDAQINEINQKLDLSDGIEKTTRSDRELLEDILNSVRSLARTATPLRDSWEVLDQGWEQHYNELFSLSSSARWFTGSTSVSLFKASTAAKLANISSRQLDHWGRTGLVIPSIQTAADSEPEDFYSVKDILILKTVKRLLDIGQSMGSIRVIADHLKRRSIIDIAKLTLFSDGTTVHEAASLEEINDLLVNGQGFFGIPIRAAIQEIAGAISEIQDLGHLPNGTRSDNE